MSTVAKAEGGPAVAPDAAQGAPKKRRSLLIIIAAVVVLCGGGAAFWFLRPAEASSAGNPAEATADAAAHKAAPVYYKFDPAFVVNFGTPGNVRYLQIMLEAMSRDSKVLDELKLVEPAIRNDLMLLFSSQQYEDLLTQEGKEKLRQATLEAVRKALAAENGDADGVERVYFTSLVIQ
jgi:flagellar FliL protein